MMRLKFFVFGSALLVLVSMMGQTTTGAITGTVTDPSGASVPGVKVTATNTATNLASNTQSNESGVYNFPFLPIGDYAVTAEAQGFKKTVLTPFRLEVNQIARVDLRMEVGAIAESVEVRDVTPVLQTETTQTGSVLNAANLTEIPLNGRNFVNLTLLAPGTVSTNPQNMTTSGRFQNQGSRPYVNGNREQTNNFLLDGIDANDSIDNRIGYQPNVDALEEVKVLTGNAPAEFGNAAGAIVNAQLKSGTNNFHGDLFEFLRNDKLDANTFFNNRSNAAKRAFRRNIFGGTLGGPIIKNKAFFFVDYEGTRQRDSGPSLASVPLAQYRTGDLSRFPQTIKDPLNNNTPFTGNVIPQARIVNPVAKALFADQRLYPMPNRTGSGTLGIANNYVGISANALQNDQADAKVDVRLTERDNLSGRWSISRYFTGDSATALPTQMTPNPSTTGPTTSAVATWTRTISPTMVNEFRVGFARTVISDVVLDPTGLLGANGNAKLGIPGGQPVAGASEINAGDGITLIGSRALNGESVENNYQIGNNLTISKGLHFLKMGGQVVRYQQNRYYAGNNGALGFFTYASAKYTGDSFADFLLNQLSEKGRGSVTGKWGHRHSRAGIFFQDDWKVRRNLTLNLGIRWEYTQPVYEVADRQSNFDLITGKQLFAGKDGNSRALYNAYYKQFMPRVGFAWVPGAGKKLVVRGGYAIISFMEGTGANLRLPLNPPFFFESDTIYDLNKPGDISLGFTDALPLNVPSGTVRAWDPNLRPQFTQQWNFSLEHQFTNTFSLTAAYVGQKATHTVVPREGNQPLPGIGPVSTWAPLQTRRPLYAAQPLITTIAVTDSPSNMNYNGLQVTGRKRMANGLELVSSYTLSKTLTDNRGFYGGGPSFINGEGAYWQNAYNRTGDRGRAFFDARHNFNFGGNWELPVGKNRAFGKTMSRAVDWLVGGWTTSFLVVAHSGFPVTMLGLDGTNQAVRGNVRPNQYRALTYQNQSIDNWFGTGNTFCAAGIDDGKCAYGNAAPGLFGNSSIASEQAPSYFDFDTSVGKQFNLSERRYFDFRMEMFNAFNHASFGPPARDLTSPGTLGQITIQSTLPRNIQFGLKFHF